MLLDAAECAAIAPLPSSRLHAFAYLADVLSPVWNLPAFDGKILRLEEGPHYPDLQEELERLVVLGLVEVSGLRYERRGDYGARLEGDYGLRFESQHLRPLLSALGAGDSEAALDASDSRLHHFLVELAGAIGTLPARDVDRIVSVDATYGSKGYGENVIDFGDWSADPRADNPSWRTADRFQRFLPEDATITKAEKIYLYADYLRRAASE